MKTQMLDPRSINNSYQHQGGLGSTDDLLKGLGDRVSKALNGPVQGAGQGNNPVVDKVNPSEVRNYISQISQQPLPGMIQNSVV